METVSYLFTPGKRSILVEIYFPRRIKTQETIFKALSDGLAEKKVIAYLDENVGSLMQEFSVYPHWLDPNRYGANFQYANTIDTAKARISMYRSVFYGWSEYAVDGVYLKNDGVTIDEERTQVLKLIFTFQDKELEVNALNAGHIEVYLAILNWILSQYGQAEDHRHWSDGERDLFLFRNASWSESRKNWTRDNFVSIAVSIAKWIDDCGLFTFGYVVRQFWEEIVRIHQQEGGKLEDEIWVSSIFHVDINVLKPDNS